MPKKSISHEDQLIDLLQKLLIVELYSSGVKRDDIARILSIANAKVSAVTKYLHKARDNKNE